MGRVKILGGWRSRKSVAAQCVGSQIQLFKSILRLELFSEIFLDNSVVTRIFVNGRYQLKVYLPRQHWAKTHTHTLVKSKENPSLPCHQRVMLCSEEYGELFVHLP